MAYRFRISEPKKSTRKSPKMVLESAINELRRLFQDQDARRIESSLQEYLEAQILTAKEVFELKILARSIYNCTRSQGLYCVKQAEVVLNTIESRNA